MAEYDAFLSCAWGVDGQNLERVKRIAKVLRERGLKVWLDVDEVKNDLGIAAIEGIDNSSVFVCFATREYMAMFNSERINNSVQTQFFYAIRRMKKIILVTMDDFMADHKNWEGTFAFRFLESEWIDFSKTENIDALIRFINIFLNPLEDAETDERFRRAFIYAVDHGDSVQWLRAKIMLLGAGKAGKTSTVRALVGEDFIEEHISTVGGELSQITTRNWKRLQDAEDLKLAYHRIAANNLTQQTSEDTNTTTEPRKSSGKKSSRRFWSLRKPRFSARKRPSSVEFDEKMLEQEVNVRKPFTLSFWDFGGQAVFHTLHHLFLTRYGVYLLVFDMNVLVKMLREARTEEDIEQEHQLKFWLESVKVHAAGARIILVGTRFDIINTDEDLDKIDTYLLDTIEVESYDVVVPAAAERKFLCVNNKKGEGLEELQNQILKVLDTEDYLQRQISCRWVQVLHDVRKGGNTYMEKDELWALCEKHRVSDESEREEMLELFHALGVVIHLTHTNELCQRVIVNPQWLLSELTKVIRDDKLHVSDMERTELNKRNVKKSFDHMMKTGFATKKLLQFFYPNEADFVYMSQVMKETLLLCEINGDEYLIPSLTPDEEIDDWDDGDFQIYFDFPHVTDGLFQRLICATVEKSFSMGNFRVPDVMKRFAKISYGDTELGFCWDGNRIFVTFSDDNHLTRLIEIFQGMLILIREQFLDGNHDTLPSLFVMNKNRASVSVEDLKICISLKRKHVWSGKKKFPIDSFEPFVSAMTIKSTLFAPFTSRSMDRFDAFLSHAWGESNQTHKRVVEVARKLTEAGLNVWVEPRKRMGTLMRP